VILLHGVGEAGEAWAPIGAKLAEHGLRVLAPDLRGHGDSSWSSERVYDAASMAADLKEVFLELDLYKRRCALVGAGLGAAVAADFAARFPRLVGLLALVDYDPSASSQAYCKVQGAGQVPNHRECLQLLTSPLMREQRRTPAAAEKAAGVIFRQDALLGHWTPRMDPNFHMPGPPRAALGRSLASLRCKVLYLHAFEESTVAAVEAMCGPEVAANMSVARMQKSSGFSVSDSPFEVYKVLKGALLGTRASSAVFPFTEEEEGEGEGGGGARSRTPESLGLKPLPQFDSLEEAFKALGPRQIPTREAIQQELDKLRAEEGGPASSEDEDGEDGRRRRTGLSFNPPEYFGMVG